MDSIYRMISNFETGGDFPNYFVADQAFPLTKYLLQPYPGRDLNAFGMMSSKFAVLSTSIANKNVNNIIQPLCTLHNFIRKREGMLYRSMFHFNDSDNEEQNSPGELIQKPLLFPARYSAANK